MNSEPKKEGKLAGKGGKDASSTLTVKGNILRECRERSFGGKDRGKPGAARIFAREHRQLGMKKASGGG